MQQKFRGKCPRGGDRASATRVNEKKNEATSTQSKKGNGTRRGRGFRRGKGKYAITCYKCGVEGHKTSKCPERHNSRKRSEAKT